jgi:NADH-quinone oxidoreductase subunit N
MAVAMSFKVAAFPFHQWAPDVYEGSPTVVTAFMSTAGKAAAFSAFMALFIMLMPATSTLTPKLQLMLAVVSAITMLVGNITAVVQTNIKRMLAYSSIAHAGYLFYALLGAGPGRAQAVVFYVVVYGIMNVLAFTALPRGTDDARSDRLESLQGLYQRRPFAAIMLGISIPVNCNSGMRPPVHSYKSHLLIPGKIFTVFFTV